VKKRPAESHKIKMERLEAWVIGPLDVRITDAQNTLDGLKGWRAHLIDLFKEVNPPNKSPTIDEITEAFKNFKPLVPFSYTVAAMKAAKRK